MGTSRFRAPNSQFPLSLGTPATQAKAQLPFSWNTVNLVKHKHKKNTVGNGVRDKVFFSIYPCLPHKDSHCTNDINSRINYMYICMLSVEKSCAWALSAFFTRDSTCETSISKENSTSFLALFTILVLHPPKKCETGNQKNKKCFLLGLTCPVSSSRTFTTPSLDVNPWYDMFLAARRVLM